MAERRATILPVVMGFDHILAVIETIRIAHHIHTARPIDHGQAIGGIDVGGAGSAGAFCQSKKPPNSLPKIPMTLLLIKTGH